MIFFDKGARGGASSGKVQAIGAVRDTRAATRADRGGIFHVRLIGKGHCGLLPDVPMVRKDPVDRRARGTRSPEVIVPLRGKV